MEHTVMSVAEQYRRRVRYLEIQLEHARPGPQRDRLRELLAVGWGRLDEAECAYEAKLRVGVAS